MKPADAPLSNRAGLCRQTEPPLSWEKQLSNKFRSLAAHNKEKVNIIELDAFYPSITFLVEGDFWHKNGDKVHVGRRIVSPLPKGQ